MKKQDFRDKLKNRILLMDGAMGTYFSHLHPEAGEAELANVEHPDWVQEIHERYLEAGARVIRTNTFAVNHGLFRKEELSGVIAAAVAVAREAVAQKIESEQVYIAGSVGPIPVDFEGVTEEILQEYRVICDSLLKNGIRIIMLETFSDVEVAKKVAALIKSMDNEVFVHTQFSINRMGYTLYGQSADKIVKEVEECPDIDGVGFNCGIGATHMSKQLSKITFSKDIILSVLPNAGYEQGLQGRHFLLDNPDYYAKTLEEMLSKGVNLVGGCCGTTPAHIKALHKMLQGKDTPVPKQLISTKEVKLNQREKNPFIEKLHRGEKVYVVEIDSPFDGNGDKFLAGAQLLKENEVDLVTISDSPLARPRAEAFMMGCYIGGKTGVRVMPHICCRDRNMIGLRSAVLGAHINGMRDMLIITGDPVGRDDRGTITSVFDMNSIRLMEYVRNMNEELFPEEPFYYGGALNYAGVNVEAIAERMRRKMEAGCSYFLTQPVYSREDIARVRDLKQRTAAKILVGLMPLVSYKNAMFMKNEMPGIDVPDEVIHRYRGDMSREEAEATAVSVCVDIGKQVQDFADGYYVMTPFNRVAMVNRIINELREQEQILS
jgi:homocysteine S-methyltransferase